MIMKNWLKRNTRYKITKEFKESEQNYFGKPFAFLTVLDHIPISHIYIKGRY